MGKVDGSGSSWMGAFGRCKLALELDLLDLLGILRRLKSMGFKSGCSRSFTPAEGKS